MIIAGLALIVSLAPHLWRWVRPRSAKVEVSPVAQVMHSTSGPVLGLSVSILNDGSKDVRVHELVAKISRDGGPTVEAECEGYFLQPGPLQPMHGWIPFHLKPGESWGGYFCNFSDRDLDNVAADRAAQQALSDTPPNDTKSRTDIIRRRRAMYTATLPWKRGEYRVTIEARIEEKSKPSFREVKFVLHESEVGQIQNAVKYSGDTFMPVVHWPMVPVRSV